jgi:hypothetical protein
MTEIIRPAVRVSNSDAWVLGPVIVASSQASDKPYIKEYK